MWKITVQPDRPQKIWRMRIARWIPKATNTHSEYVILIAFRLLQWLHGEADNLPPYSADVKKSRSFNSPRPLWACMACNGCALPLPLQWLHEGASILRFTYIACLFIHVIENAL
jgi:hypothetical protein